jgi:hypothetical protein
VKALGTLGIGNGLGESIPKPYLILESGDLEDSSDVYAVLIEVWHLIEGWTEKNVVVWEVVVMGHVRRYTD